MKISDRVPAVPVCISQSTDQAPVPQESSAVSPLVTSPLGSPPVDQRPEQLLEEVKRKELDTLLPMDPAITMGRLDNGLTYYIRANDRPAESASLRLVVKGGSAMEQDHQEGISHFLEHLVFHGSAECPDWPSLIQEMEQAGCGFGVHQNASTQPHQTVYKFDIPLENPALLERSLKLLRGFAFSARLSPESVEHERKVVLEEARQRLGASTRFIRANWGEIYGHLPQGRPVEGKPETISAMTSEALQDYYQRWYRPELMAVVAIGQFDVQEVERQIIQVFGEVPASPQVEEVNFSSFQGPLPFQVMQWSDPEAGHGEVMFRWRYADPVKSPTLRRLKEDLVGDLLNGVINVRLKALLDRLELPCYATGAQDGSGRPGIQFQDLLAICPQDRVRETVQSLWRELSRFQRHGVSDEELASVKRAIFAGCDLEEANGDKCKNSFWVKGCVGHFVERSAVPARLWSLKKYRQLVEQITAEELHEAVKSWTVDNSCLLILGCSQEEPLHSTEEVREWLRQVEEETLAPFEAPRPSLDWLEQRPLPGKVVEIRRHEGIDAVDLRLSNGLTVTFKPCREIKTDLIIEGVASGGYGSFGPDYRTAGTLCSTWMGDCGVGGASPSELAEVMRGTYISYGTSLGATSRKMLLQGNKEHMEKGLRVLRQVFLTPLDDHARFKKVKEQAISISEAWQRAPGWPLSELKHELTTQGHWLQKPCKGEELATLEYERLRDLQNAAFANADGFHFIIVGDATLDEILPLVETYLASLPVGKSQVPYTPTYGVSFPEGVRHEVVRSGMEDKGNLQVFFPLPTDFSWRDRCLFGALGTILKNRLLQRLRLQLGESYSPYVSSSFPYAPDTSYGLATIGVGGHPEKLEELREEALSEITKLVEEGINQEELEGYRVIARRTRKDERQTRRHWLGLLENAHWWGWDLSEHDLPERWLEEVKGEELQALARRVFRLDNYASVIHTGG